MIRLLSPADLDEFRAVRLAALSGHAGEFGAGAEAWAAAPQAMISTLLGQPWIFGAVDGGVVGMVGLRREPKEHTAHKASLWGLYVAPTHRRRGHARAMLTAALAQARADGLESVRAVVTTKNAAAVGLLTSAGFSPFGIEERARKVGDTYLDQLYLRISL